MSLQSLGSTIIYCHTPHHSLPPLQLYPTPSHLSRWQYNNNTIIVNTINYRDSSSVQESPFLETPHARAGQTSLWPSFSALPPTKPSNHKILRCHFELYHLIYIYLIIFNKHLNLKSSYGRLKFPLSSPQPYW